MILVITAVAVNLPKPVIPPGEKVVVEKTVIADTGKIIITDTLITIRHDTTRIIKTWKDTVKLIKNESFVTSRIDTLWTKKYTRGK